MLLASVSFQLAFRELLGQLLFLMKRDVVPIALPVGVPEMGTLKQGCLSLVSMRSCVPVI